MKHLPKHLRPRWRYLAVEIEAWPDTDLDRRAFQRALWSSARALLGDPGSADADLRVLRFSFEGQVGAGSAIVRVRRGEIEPARAALACVDRVADQPVGVVVRGVSGTIRGCEANHRRRVAEEVTERTVEFAGAEREAVAHHGRFDLDINGEMVGATDLDRE